MSEKLVVPLIDCSRTPRLCAFRNSTCMMASDESRLMIYDDFQHQIH